MDIACHLKIRLFLSARFFLIVVKQVDVPLGME